MQIFPKADVRYLTDLDPGNLFLLKLSGEDEYFYGFSLPPTFDNPGVPQIVIMRSRIEHIASLNLTKKPVLNLGTDWWLKPDLSPENISSGRKNTRPGQLLYAGANIYLTCAVKKSDEPLYVDLNTFAPFQWDDAWLNDPHRPFFVEHWSIDYIDPNNERLPIPVFTTRTKK